METETSLIYSVVIELLTKKVAPFSIPSSVILCMHASRKKYRIHLIDFSHHVQGAFVEIKYRRAPS